jgi:hypothetical protein
MLGELRELKAETRAVREAITQQAALSRELTRGLEGKVEKLSEEEAARANRRAPR